MGFMALGLKAVADAKKNVSRKSVKSNDVDVTMGGIAKNIKDKNFGRAVDDLKHISLGKKKR